VVAVVRGDYERLLMVVVVVVVVVVGDSKGLC
jgi:hypothetical protein